MTKWIYGLAFCVAALAMNAAAQTTVTNNNDGAIGTIPVYAGNASLGNSVVTQSNGNVGIGTTNPFANLQVHTGANQNLNISGPRDFSSGTTIWSVNDANTAYQPLDFEGTQFSFIGGNVGIGRSDPHNHLDVSTQLSKADLTETSPITISTNETYANNPFVFYMGLIGSSANSTRIAVLQTTNYAQDNLGNIAIQPHGGNVGIGTTNPLFALDVAGQVHSSTGYVFPDGTTQSTAFIPSNCGADYAESVDVTGDRTKYEPGDILVIDLTAPGKFLKSNQAYSTLVAGIYSSKPGFVGRLHPEDAKTDKTEVPMAMVGRVPTKVTAENGPIKVGDLLVASSTLGRAMKGTDRSQMLSAVIGKALGSLDSGTGVIEVLVTLQ